MATNKVEIDQEILEIFVNALKLNPNVAGTEIATTLGCPFNDYNIRLYTNMARAYIMGESAKLPMSQRMVDAGFAHIKAKEEKKSAMTEIIMTGLREVFSTLPKITAPPAPKLDKKAEIELVLPHSDMHVGKNVRWDDVGGLGEYNSEIFLKRVSSYQAHFENMIEHKKGRIKRIWLPMLGDLIDGKKIYRSQASYLDPAFRGVLEQVKFTVDALADHFVFLSTFVPQVVVMASGGNHARIGMKGEDHWTDNFDLLVFFMLRERLKAHKRIVFIEPKGNYLFFSVLGWNFYAEHGENIRSWGGIPYYGLERAAGQVQQLVQTLVHYYLVGHHHNPGEFGNATKVLVNGNWAGADNFSVDVLKKGGPPSQQYFEVHPHYGVSDCKTIFLENRLEWGKTIPETMEVIVP
jgi:hypothetical protein